MVQQAGGTVSYGALAGRIATHASTLQRAGVARGDRCGVIAPQGVGFVEAALGVMAAGACLVPIPPDQPDGTLETFVARAGLAHVVRVDGDVLSHGACTGAPVSAPIDDAAFRALAPAYLRYTSGTTSARKGVVLGHATILARLDAANRGMQIDADDRIMWLLPMAHHFVVSILLYLQRGATVLLPSSSLAQPVLEFAQSVQPTVFYASPYHYNLLAKDRSARALESVRLAVSTAEGLRADIGQRFATRFGQPLVQALGIIEVGLSIMNLVRPQEKPTALGRPLPDYDVWLRGEDGHPVPDPSAPERSGEICIRGPGLFDAYLEPWTPARALLDPDGFRTGDQGWRDADGDLHLAGRRANRISMAGMKFFSEEVEAILDAHPGVARSRVRPMEHAHLGEIPIAEIVPADPTAPPSATTLGGYCREQLAAYKVPRRFEIVPELPLTLTGKLSRGREG